MSKRSPDSPSAKQALRRVEKARSSYAKAEDRVGTLRLRLHRAEQKLVQRAERLSRAEAAVAVAHTASVRSEVETPEEAADTLATIAAGTMDNGATPAKRTRTRRKTASPEDK